MKGTQNEMILHHMKMHGSITTMEAFQMYGVTRLSGRIWELRKNHNIIGTPETTSTGKKIVRYSLKEGEE